MTVTTTSDSITLIPAGLWDELARRVRLAFTRSQSAQSTVLASVSIAVDGTIDPLGTISRALVPDEPWFVLEQPDRESMALAGLGAALTLESHGDDRFSQLSSRWRDVATIAVGDPPGGPRGSGIVAVGGFSFAPDGAQTPEWEGFAPASLVVPTLALARRGTDVRVTVTVAVDSHAEPDAIVASARDRLAAVRPGAVPLWDPDPATRARVASVMPPEHYEQAVARGVERITRGDMVKIVLAREVDVHAGRPHDPAAVLGVLRDTFPGCFLFAVGRGDAAFIGATPELLVRRDGMRAGTLALAGSTPRSADPGVDRRLGEQLLGSAKNREEHAIVCRRIAEALRPYSVWVTAPEVPVTVAVANIQHLATPIRAQLARSVSVIELAGILHPTPAVGGEPFAEVKALIPALEGFDRGWYAGPVGWVDTNEDGEFCVALRCAMLRGRRARLYAGVGVVQDSDPEAELMETDVKLSALLPLLTG